MSAPLNVMVNLLPQEVSLRRAARRTTKLTVLAVLLFVVVLGGLHMVKLNQITEAEQERDLVQADVQRLQAELASLQEYRVLSDEHDARNTLLATAMGNEISFARVLNDISMGFPQSSSMRSLKVSVQTPEPEEGAISFGEAVAMLTYEGYSAEEFSPGVEAVMLELDKLGTFFSPYLGASAQEDIGATEVTGFQGTVQLNDDAFTRRYAEGLPEEVAK